MGTVLVDQRLPDNRQLGWQSLGVFTIQSGMLGVELTDAGTEDGYVIADAVRVVRL